MIIAKAPLRLEFAGGSTDIKSFYENEQGSILSATINKYMYLAVHKYFYNKVLLKYSETELVDSIEHIKHPLFRECLRLLNLTKGVEVTVIGDIPSGTGIGTSSSFTVALLHALHAYKGEHVSPERLAQEACHIEITAAKSPIGKQDQYMAAYGGINYISFNPDETVKVQPIICKPETIKELNKNLLLFYTGTQRSTNNLLAEQMKNIKEKMLHLRKMKVLSEKARDALINNDLEAFASAFHEDWSEKKVMNPAISNSMIESCFEKAFQAGAKARRLVGAGAGGFILLYCDREKQDRVRMALHDLKEINFEIDPQGSRIVYVGN